MVRIAFEEQFGSKRKDHGVNQMCALDNSFTILKRLCVLPRFCGKLPAIVVKPLEARFHSHFTLFSPFQYKKAAHKSHLERNSEVVARQMGDRESAWFK